MASDARDREILKKMQAELSKVRERAALLDGILDTAADAIISVDAEQQITQFNKGATKVFGYSADELTGMPLKNLIPEKFRQAHAEHVEKFRQSPLGNRQMKQGRMVAGLRQDGSHFPAKAAIFRHDVLGNDVSTVYLRDMTEYQLADDAVRQSREVLSHLTRVGLLGEISTSLAHEINQPLTAVLAVLGAGVSLFTYCAVLGAGVSLFTYCSARCRC